MTRTASGLALVSLLGLVACEGGVVNVLNDPRTQQVEIGEDTFFVLIDGNVATVSNFATGLNNQLRLREGAQAAIAAQTDCAVQDFFKFENVNKYQARLIC